MGDGQRFILKRWAQIFLFGGLRFWKIRSIVEGPFRVHLGTLHMKG